MTLIEGIGDEVIQVFVALFFILIVALAWCTTSISNEGTLRTVFLLELRRLRAARRLTNHTESATIAEGTTVNDSEPDQSSSTMEENKPPESTTDNENSQAQGIAEERRIVDVMDAPKDAESANDLRRRRLAFYNKTSDETDNLPHDSASSVSQNELNQTKEEKVASPRDMQECSIVENVTDSETNEVVLQDPNKICIKLMYLNDQLRHVDGTLQEKLGDFKRRHFEVELAANKLVKLIFNGHVLQQDADTLEKCGFFDNCVVHCLIHQRPANSSNNSNSNSREGSRTFLGINSHGSNNNNNPPHEWHLENYLFAILCCFLGAAWYLRYVYSHLYTVTATIGLILMTGIFTIIMFGMHFPDNVELNQRTENVRSHQ